MRVVLQDRGRPQCTHGALDQLVDCLRLSLTGGQEDDVAGLHDRAEPLGEAVGRHRVDVAPEEAGVVDPRLSGEGLDPGAGGERRSLAR